MPDGAPPGPGETSATRRRRARRAGPHGPRRRSDRARSPIARPAGVEDRVRRRRHPRSWRRRDARTPADARRAASRPTTWRFLGRVRRGTGQRSTSAAAPRSKAGPWSQGPVLLQQLALLEGFGSHATEPASTRCTRSSSARSSRSPTATPGTATRRDVPLDALLSEAYTAERRALVGATASLELRPGSPGRARARWPRLRTHAADGRGRRRADRGDAASPRRHLPHRRRRPLGQPRLGHAVGRVAAVIAGDPVARLLAGHAAADVLARARASPIVARARHAAAHHPDADARRCATTCPGSRSARRAATSRSSGSCCAPAHARGRLRPPAGDRRADLHTTHSRLVLAAHVDARGRRRRGPPRRRTHRGSRATRPRGRPCGRLVARPRLGRRPRSPRVSSGRRQCARHAGLRRRSLTQQRPRRDRERGERAQQHGCRRCRSGPGRTRPRPSSQGRWKPCPGYQVIVFVAERPRQHVGGRQDDGDCGDRQVVVLGQRANAGGEAEREERQRRGEGTGGRASRLRTGGSSRRSEAGKHGSRRRRPRPRRDGFPPEQPEADGRQHPHDRRVEEQAVVADEEVSRIEWASGRRCRRSRNSAPRRNRWRP